MWQYDTVTLFHHLYWYRYSITICTVTYCSLHYSVLASYSSDNIVMVNHCHCYIEWIHTFLDWGMNINHHHHPHPVIKIVIIIPVYMYIYICWDTNEKSSSVAGVVHIVKKNQVDSLHHSNPRVVEKTSALSLFVYTLIMASHEQPSMTTSKSHVYIDETWDATIDTTLRRVVYGSFAGGIAALVLFRTYLCRTM